MKGFDPLQMSTILYISDVKDFLCLYFSIKPIKSGVMWLLESQYLW